MTQIIKSIRLENLRSLKDTGDIDLKPITILVGKNSVGKSTFARSFPLIRQSCAEEKKSPILWYGKLVDFGDFRTSKNRNSPQDYIGFSFKIDTKTFFNYSGDLRRFDRINNEDRNNIKDDIYVTLHISESQKNSYCSFLKIKIFDNVIEAYLNKEQKIDNLKINEIGFDKLYFKEKNLNIRVLQRDILPLLDLVRINKDNISRFEKGISENLLFNEINSLCNHKSIKAETLHKIMKYIPISSKENIYKYLCDTKLISLNNAVKKLNIEEEKFRNICALVYLTKLTEITFYLDQVISRFFSNTHYLEPLRATAQRYYRRQELAIDEIDSKGSNIAMFVDSLNDEELKSLKSMMAENFNIEIGSRRDEGHIALTLKHLENNNNEQTNIADLGMGYSQILPFIIQLWAATERKSSKFNWSPWRERCFVIEQPELHLHPAYQAKIADVIAKVISSHRKKLSIVLETHSQHLLYRFGELIEDEALGLSPDDIQILVFNERDGFSEVSISNFNSDGELENWPTGFFQP